MTKRILITGVSGFAGRYMCEYLSNLGQQLDITGTDIVEPRDNLCSRIITADMSCTKTVEGIIEQIKPDYIIHLAGTFGGSDNYEMHRVNVLSMSVLLEAVVKYVPDSVLVATGSAAEYGRVCQEQLPVSENCSCEPVTPYGLSKLLATQIAVYYHRVHNVNVVILRPFQLIGKGVTCRLAPGAFHKHLVNVISQGEKVIKVGNLESSRDFIDIRDAVEAIWMLCKRPASGEIFNLCSGQATKMADLLNMMIECAGVDVKPEIDPARLRGSSDVSQIYGTFEKLQNHCGWSPKITLDKSIAEMFT